MTIQTIDDSATHLQFIDKTNPLQHIGKTVSVIQAKLAPELLEALVEASDHLDYCNYGDNYEREGTGPLRSKIYAAIAKATT